jgi:energy-coupling factor transporter transmembrane protein EcfT
MPWPAVQTDEMTRRQWVIGCFLLILGIAACLVTRWMWWSSDFNLWILLLYFVPFAFYLGGMTVITWGAGRFRKVEAPMRDPSHELQISQSVQPNSTLHTDARASAVLNQTPSARAGERGR